MGIASLEGDMAAAHANIAFGQGGISDEVSYGLGVAFAPAARMTLSAEMIGRRLSDLGRITETVAAHPTIADVETLRLTATTDSRISVVSGIGSLKWNLTETWLFKTSVIVPLNDAGLTAPVRLTLGLDYAFGG